jgi:hypothetical protein
MRFSQFVLFSFLLLFAITVEVRGTSDNRWECAKGMANYPYAPLFATTWPKRTLINDEAPGKNMFAIEWADWLAPDEEFSPQLAMRKDLYRDRPEEVFAVYPGFESKVQEASQELLEKLALHLSTHFPQYYRFDGRTVTILPLNETYDIHQTEIHPLILCGYLVEDDLTLSMQNEKGDYILVAGFLAIPSDWSLTQKIGKTTLDIHEHVPGYAEKIAMMVNKLFASIRPDKIHGRNNWKFYENPNLSQPKYALDRYEVKEITQDNVSETLFMRTEWQSVVRLPKSNAVLFTIRPRTFTLPHLKKYEPETVAKIVAAMKKGQVPSATNTRWSGWVTDYLAAP